MHGPFGVATWLAALCLWVAAPLPAFASEFGVDAANTVVRSGVIVRIQEGEFVIDLGGADGLSVGDPARMFRTIKVKHPVSGREVIDRFLLGECSVLELAPHMAILRPDKPWMALLQLGDRVDVQTRKPAEKSEAQPAKKPAAEAPLRCAPSLPGVPRLPG